ncbi:FliM/FliN family flagellar motor switch protein [Actibacterium ureilyticum]|uniref:FliM/FliN family flagellar motor switch protein n=1 Tax=Actibacterium ureilyticum TaxID=1590614 RepID=UPI000BAADC49|nr:FliM/FliN family flagellar motor C-terminal domain-containing protein [Actibacterium ureilyticum]
MDNAEQSPATDQSPLTLVPLEITICVGRARPLVRELLALDPGAVLPLDRNIDDPVELFVGDRLIARGELQEVENGPPGQLAVRLTEVADMKDVL